MALFKHSRRDWLRAAAALTAILGWQPLAADDAAPRGEALRVAYYLYGVTEYCGLNSFEVYDGFQRQMRDIIDREGLVETEARRLRLRGMTDADLEYGNRGLGGFRNWCRTEGKEAAERFVAFRAGQMSQQQTTP